MDEQQQQQQPLKKQKIDDNNNNKRKENKEIEILNKIDFNDVTILNFIKIYNLFKKYPQYDSIRLKSVKYFIIYHRNKIPQMVDVNGFIKFIVNVFYDPSDMVFNEIINMNDMYSRLLLDTIIETIVNDKRFKQSKEYKKRLKKLESANDFKIPTVNDSNKIIKLDNKNKVVYKKEYNLPNILIYKIIDYIFSSKTKEYYDCDYDSINREIYNYSLVSKQFIKILSKYFNNNPPQQDEFPTLTPIEDTNTSTTGNGNWRLIIQPPLMFDYNWMNHIKYNWNENQINTIFSKVETLIINSDEADIYTNERGKFKRDIKDWYDEFDGYCYGEYYRESISLEGYLIYPPLLPSLKSLIIKEYCGYYNYSNLFSYIIKLNNQSINHFSISINLDDEDETYNDNPIIFFKDLFKYHSNTLNLIEIECSKYEILTVLNIFKIFKSCNNIEFKERVKFNIKIFEYETNILDDNIMEYYEYHYFELFRELKIFLKNQNKSQN